MISFMRNVGDTDDTERMLWEVVGKHLILESNISGEASVMRLYAAAVDRSVPLMISKKGINLSTDASQVFACSFTYGVSTPSIFWRAEVNGYEPGIKEKVKKENHYFSFHYHSDDCHVVDVLHKNVQ